MNLSFIIGNLGADAEIVDANGSKFIKFSVADSRKYKRQDGQEVNSVSWVDAVISNPDHPVLPFLKAGQKVAIVGQSDLRVYSSAKEKCMKAGQTIHVFSVELCGGSTDVVPRELIDPQDGTIHPVTKHYWCDADISGLKKGEARTLYDSRNRVYEISYLGFVTPVVEEGSASKDGAEDAMQADKAVSQNEDDLKKGSSGKQ